MSKTCKERRPDRLGDCGLPAMTQHDGRWVCFGCKGRLEDASKPKPGDERP